MTLTMSNKSEMMFVNGGDFFFPVSTFPNLGSISKSFFILLRNFFSKSGLESIESDENVTDMLTFQKGDKQGFLRIYNRNKRKVYSWAYRMLHNEAVAEEISQEVFIRVLRMQKTYMPTAKFTTLLYTITSNLVFNESRRRFRHPEDGMEQEELQNIPDISNEWMMAMEKEQKKEILERAIQKVSDRQRAVLMLRYIDEMSHEEIAQIMELSIQAVKSLLHRGLQSLMIILKQEGVLIQ
jgi:RNA polymerase sigma-70 factor (ECF subfamily)